MERNRIQKYYNSVVAEDFLILYNLENVMQLPRINRAVLSTSSKTFLLDKQEVLNAFAASSLLTGQKSKPTRAQQSIATFQLRKGSIIGCVTTVRRSKMYALFDKVVTCILPCLQASLALASLSNQPMQALLAAPAPSPYGEGEGETPLSSKQNLVSHSMHRHSEGNYHSDSKKQSSKRKDLDLQFGVKEATLFPEMENLFEVLSVAQGFYVLFSLSLPRSSPKNSLSRLRRTAKAQAQQAKLALALFQDKSNLQDRSKKGRASHNLFAEKTNASKACKTGRFSSGCPEKQKDLVFLSAFQYPSTFR